LPELLVGFLLVDWKRALDTLFFYAEPVLVVLDEEAGLGPAAPLVVGGALGLTRQSLLT
jgi:hypothetical protein